MTPQENNHNVKLKVAEAIQDDVNKGIVRIDSTFMHRIGLRPGDFVHIEGTRKTVALVDRAYPGDIGLNIIRMDGLTRRNAKTAIGEYVTLSMAEVKEAKSVTIAPSQKGINVSAPPSLFKQGLLGQAVLKGDVVSLGGTRKRRNMMSQNPFFSDIFNIMDENLAGFGFSDLKFIVAKSAPDGPVVITENTAVEYNPEAIELKEGEAVPEVSYEDIGGLGDAISKVREMVELPLKHPEIFDQLGIDPPKGILLHGPPGTGKTLLAKAVANETNSNFILINGPEIMSKFYGESEANLRKKFEEAQKNSPSIIFIDEIDAIAPAREESKGEVERRVVAQLLAIMDGLQSRGRVVVIAATNIPNALDPALRRPGRFDRELEISPPSKEGRSAILKIHTRNMPLNIDLKNIGVTESKKDIITNTYDHIGKIDLHNIANIILQSHSEKGKGIDVDQKKRALKAIAEVITQSTKDVALPNSLKRYLFKRMAGDFYSSTVEKKTALDIVDALTKRLAEMKDESKLSSLIDESVRDYIIDEIAEVTHGFVGADLASLSRETAMVVLRKVLPQLSLDKEEAIPQEMLDKLDISPNDFRDALHHVRPSAMREVMVEVPNVKWDDIGGLAGLKQSLKEAVEWPLLHPERFSRLGIKPPKGILLYGPPGTGKTMLAKAVANESNANFISIKGPELLSKWVGESEKAVRKVFHKARQLAPSIIFFDEIDSLAPIRGGSSDNSATERVVNQLLTELDGLETLADVVVVAATNRPDIVDPALLRPGRFDRVILANAPDTAMRENIIKIHTKNIPLGDNFDVKKLAQDTDGYVGADIEALAREAAILALRDDPEAKIVKMSHFAKAMKKVRASVTAEVAKNYADLEEKFQSAQGSQVGKERQSYFG